MRPIDQNLDFDKGDGLLPAIVQDRWSGKVLMLGYMNQQALDKTRESGKVTFFSRSKNRLWTKGESSGHYLSLHSLSQDCDGDTILVQAEPHGPVCHLGSDTCFLERNRQPTRFIEYLQELLAGRRQADPKTSYTARLLQGPLDKSAQKVGEEAVELVIEAIANRPDRFRAEAADLLFHYLVLLEAKGIGLNEILEELMERHANLSSTAKKEKRESK